MNNFSHPNHRCIKDALSGSVGDSFIANFYKLGGFWKSYRNTPAYHITARRAEECPIVKRAGTKSTGVTNWNTVWIDYVILAQPEKSIIHDGVFSIALEIKSSYNDLLNAPRQFENYRGTCDYHLVAVPNRLIREALTVLKDKKYIGVMSYETGEVVKMPCKAKTEPVNVLRLYQRLAFCPNQDSLRYVEIFDDEE